MRPLNPDDAADFARAIADPEIVKHAYHRPPEPTHEGAVRFIARARSRLEQGDALMLAVLDAGDGGLLGKTMLHAVDAHNRPAELGGSIRPYLYFTLRIVSSNA